MKPKNDRYFYSDNKGISKSLFHIQFKHFVFGSHFHKLPSEISLVQHLLLACLSKFKVFFSHFAEFTFQSIHLKFNSRHLLMGIFQLLFHFFHLSTFFFEGLFIFYQLLMDLGSRLSGQYIFEFKEQFFFLSYQIFFPFNFLCLSNQPPTIK